MSTLVPDISNTRGMRVYRAIKKAILSLEIKPGEMLGIGTLAEQLGVSRTPVRDALLLLEREGLVTIKPQKGAIVSPISRRDVEEIFELRTVLESYAARVAAIRLTDEDLAQIEKTLEESKRKFEQGQEVAAADLGRHIHNVIIRRVDNERLTRSLSELEAQYTRIRHLAAVIPGRFVESHQQHYQILEALQARDAERAAQAMSEHFASVRASVVARVSEWTTDREPARQPRAAALEAVGGK